MAKVAQLARDWVKSRILDSSTGFNYWVDQLATSGDYPDVNKFFMSDVNTSGLNVFVGNFSDNVLSECGVDATYPMCTLYARRGKANSLKYTPTEYSGPIDIIVMFYVTGGAVDLPTGIFESTHDLILDAMLETFNRGDINSVPVPGSITYNNDMAWDREPVVPGGENWKQRAIFAISFNAPAVAPR